MASDALLRCSQLGVGFAGRAILPPIELAIGPGELWAVVGRNGSGKTTWMKTVLGLLPPVTGRVIRARSDLRLSYVPQRASVDELYPLLARDVVELGRQRGWSFLRRRGGRLSDESRRALERMGAMDLAAFPYRNLSEGQKQRVLFARLAASEAEMAFLDEPTSAMDVVAEREAFVLLDALRRECGITVLVVSHTMGVVREHADRALFFDRDTVISGTPSDVFRHEAFVARYGELEE